MTISYFRRKLKSGKTGTFRMLRAGERIDESDVIVNDTTFDCVSEQNIGQLALKTDCLLRLDFDKP